MSERKLFKVAKKFTDKIPGGLSDGKSPSDFDPKALKDGIKIEKEHTKDSDLAKEIAMDHLTEDSDYYKKLKLMEEVSYDDLVKAIKMLKDSKK